MDVFGDASLFSVFVDDDTARKQQHEQQQQQSTLGKRTLQDSPATSVPAVSSDAASSAKKAKGTTAVPEVEPDDEPIPEVEPPVVTVETTELATAQPNEIGHVTHTVCVPSFMTVTDGMRNPDYPPPRPAREYKFNLDPFQKMSIAILERQALSNQKYRELDEIFGDVGLMTGDVTINPTASCIVMTTEILRSMLYRGSEVMREVATVVFDEIHYMRDPERGVVWEETIILLPQKVKYVFLSATIPNSEEFSAWIAHTHKQPCHVVYTDIRPVPLQHYVFPAGGAGLHLVVDDAGTFREDNFQRAIAGVVAKPTGGRAGTTKEAGQSDIFKIVQLIMTKNYDPVIVFAFSKKECESLAMQMGKLSFTSEEEKKLTRDIFANAIEPLSADDQQLPQIQNVLPLLQKGIGIHHSGLLPLVKEVIEILFQEGLIKCLFATETFAMGLNMPAHTAVFSSVRKYDGREFRWISGGEYIQMSGRAGRRGKDDRGIVILMVDEKMEPDVAKGMLKGHAQPLLSAFHITYSMLLNLMRVEGLKPEALIGASFAAFQAQRKVPELQSAVAALRAELAEHTAALAAAPADEAVAPARELVQIRAKLEALRAEWETIVLHPVFSLPYLQPGRLLQLDAADAGAAPRLVWGVCIAFAKLGAGAARTDYVLDVLVVRRADEGWTVAQLPLTQLKAISSLRLPLPSDLRSGDARKGLGRKVEGVCARFAPHTPPLLDPIEDMNIRGNTALERVIKRLYTLETRLQEPRFSSAACTAAYGHAVEEARLTATLQARQTELSNARHQYLAADLQRMRRVLRRLQFITEDDVIDIKGRITCEIQASDELLLLEMLFNGLFNDMTPQLIASLLSTFVFDSERKKEKEGDPSAVPPQLMREIGSSLRTMQSLARRVATVMMECKIEISPDDYVAKFNPGMINVVYQWANGAKFSDICKLSSAFEGHIIRVIRRLEELLRQLMQASKTIGNAPLEQKFSAAIVCIKRDVVFSSSLYL